MAAPRQGGIPPLFWIILVGLVVLALVAFFGWRGTRSGVSSDVSTPMAGSTSAPTQSPAVNPNPATLAPSTQTPTATTPPAVDDRDLGTPPTGGTPLPQSDPDAD